MDFQLLKNDKTDLIEAREKKDEIWGEETLILLATSKSSAATDEIPQIAIGRLC